MSIHPATDAAVPERGALADYIREQHDVHLRAAIPFVPPLAARVTRKHGARDPRLVEVCALTLELRRRLEAHLDAEEDDLLPALRDGHPPAAHQLGAARTQHREMGATLDRLRALTDGYRAPSWACPCYRTLLEWLNAVDAHLTDDVRLEDRLWDQLAQPMQRTRTMIDPKQTVASIVLDHSECAAILQQHRIDYCCRGEMSLAAACRERGLEMGEMLGELERAISGRRGDEHDTRRLSSSALIAHILLRYHAPLRNTLPFVRGLAAKVARVHGEHNPRLIELNETVAELSDTLETHIDDEETRLFPTFASGGPGRVLLGELRKSARDEHAAVGLLLHRMRAESDDYAVPDWACTSYRALLGELERLETDVLRHVHLENHVLLPRLEEGARYA